MPDAPRVNRIAAIEGVERDLDAHLSSLRRKLQRATLRGEPVEGLQARIRIEERMIERMRAYRQGLRQRGDGK
jgi:hypothetical protein